MANEQAVALWKTQLPLYNRILQRVKESAMVPLTRFVPPSLQEKQKELKELLEIGDVQNYQQYFDVICEHVQGVRNKSIIELADNLATQLGGQIKFWQNAILDVAEYINYAGIFSVWQVRKVFESFLYIDAEHLSDYRLFSKLAKKYMSALTNLIKCINKFDQKKDSVSRIDELYKKVKSAEQKYLSYSEHFKFIQQSQTMEQLSNNISNISKKNAIKDLFNFGEPKKAKNEKSKNTLLNYKFTMGRQASQRVEQPTKNMKLTNNTMEQSRLNRFQFYLNHLKRNNISQEELKKQFYSAPQKEKSCHSINLTTIWDKDYYFSYYGHPIQVPVNLDFLNPVQEYSSLNYSFCSEDQYQDLLGEDVDNQTEMSSVSDLSHAGSFIVSDGHLSDDDDLNKDKNQPQLKTYGVFGSQWSFSSKVPSTFCQKKIEQFTMYSIYKQFPLPVAVQPNDDDQILMQLVNGKDRKQIQEAVDRKCGIEKIKITKGKVDQFLKKRCIKVKCDSNSSKYVYKLAEIQQKTSKQGLQDQKSRKSVNTLGSQKIDKKNEPETEEERLLDTSNDYNLLHSRRRDQGSLQYKKISPRVTRNRSKSQRSRSQSQPSHIQ